MKNLILLSSIALALSACGSKGTDTPVAPNTDAVGYWTATDLGSALEKYDKDHDDKALCSVFVTKGESGSTHWDVNYSRIDKDGRFHSCLFDMDGVKELDGKCSHEGNVRGNVMTPTKPEIKATASHVMHGKNKIKWTISAEGQTTEVTHYRLTKEQAGFINKFAKKCREF